MSGRSSRSTLMLTKCSFINAATPSSSNDSWAITWHQWHAAYPTESRIGTSRSAASANAAGVHCCQCTGLSACWRRYGLVAAERVLAAGLTLRILDRLLRLRRVERLGQLAQVAVHRPHQQERADQQQHDDDEPERAGLAEVRARVAGTVVGQQADREHQCAVHWSIPANRSVSGNDTGTRERANSYSSVGHSRCCHSMGVAKKKLVGSICVACARSASSRWGKYLAHSTRVVTRFAKKSWSGSQFSSHLANGPSCPCLANSSCSSCMRFLRNPWL